MRLIALVAAYQEPPGQLRACLENLTEAGTVPVVLGDELAHRDSIGIAGVGAARAGLYQKERYKRNALLELARLELEPGPADWFLSVDPDERLYDPLRLLPGILAALPAELPAYPIRRFEPNGKEWAMACKCFRATAPHYEYLDIVISFAEGPGPSLPKPWYLDPFEPTWPPRPLPGSWPHLLHLRSARADAASPDREHFYTEPAGTMPVISPAELARQRLAIEGAL